jgi:PAS domain S-box-containing protein
MDKADRPWGRIMVDAVGAEQHLDRFLLWVVLAAFAFGSTLVACAPVFSSHEMSLAGLAVVAVSPPAWAGRSALRSGHLGAALALGCLPPIAAATAAAFLIHLSAVVIPVAMIVVLVALPLVRARTLSFVFAAMLAWIVVTTALAADTTPPGVPHWFAHAFSVAALAVATALALFLIRDFHDRWTELVRSIRAAETQFRTLVEQLPAITFVDEVEDAEPFAITPLYVSPQVESILGYPVERWLSESDLWRSILHPDDRALTIGLADQIYETREPYTTEYRLIAADGRIVWIEEASVIIPGGADGPSIWQGVLFDVTARHEAEEERSRNVELVRRTDAQRRELLADLVSAQEADRKRVATEIHDDPVQKMAAVGIRLGALLRTLTGAEQIRIVSQLQETVELSIARLRALMFELRPPALDRGGLVPAVRDLIAEIDDAFPRCRIDDHLRAEPPDEIRTVAYRIAAEALANVQRHAQASEVQISFAQRDCGLFLRIRDDGVGIPAQTLAEGRPGHLGLTSIRERAEAAGGWSRIEAGPSGGRLVEAWLPLTGADTDADAGAVRSA